MTPHPLSQSADKRQKLLIANLALLPHKIDNLKKNQKPSCTPDGNTF